MLFEPTLFESTPDDAEAERLRRTVAAMQVEVDRRIGMLEARKLITGQRFGDRTRAYVEGQLAELYGMRRVLATHAIAPS